MAQNFEFRAGRLSLDFVNSIYERQADGTVLPEHEYLTTPESLQEWFKQKSQPTISSREWQDFSASSLEQIKEFREQLYALWRAAVQGKLRDQSLKFLNRILADAEPQQLVRTNNAVIWQVTPPKPVVSRIIWPIVADAADLLVHADLSRLRFCAAHDCGWIFLDESKAGKRRWCDMSDCGNRSKARRFQRRQR
ncbi:MAG: ABATE domain-containing protein [Oligoflexia bacterium]|nr:ABATE domain-containing protein [Oligoflexia bacterium]